MNTSDHPYYHKYHSQRSDAKRRGIDWQFESMQQWLDWWGDDIVNRGPLLGQLVMARFNDQGPYNQTNVYKATCSENHATKNRLTKSKRILTPEGEFDSITLAAAHYNQTVQAVSYHLRMKTNGYYYL